VIQLKIPTHVYLPRKTMPDKKIRLHQNWYRRANFQVINQAKKAFKTAVAPLLEGNSIMTPFYMIWLLYVPTKRKSDSSNNYAVLEKFFLDALVQLGYIPDDDDTYYRHRLFLPKIYAKGNDYCEVRIYNNNPFTIENKD